MFNEDSNGFVSWEEMQEEPYRAKARIRLFCNLQHPFFWILKATDLHEAAVVLRASVESSDLGDIGLENVAFMLGGMSIENLIKARHVCAEAWPVDDRSYTAIATGRHQLDQQAITLGFRTNANDRLLLKTLSHYVRWKGRYFLPRTIEEFQGAHAQPNTSHAALWNQYVALHKKLYQQVMVVMRRWPA